jgi:hypothetical protein
MSTINLAELALRSTIEPAQLKQEVNLAAVVLDAGVDLEPTGDRLTGHCPFHDDQEPSFAVWCWEDTGLWSCGCHACAPFPGGRNVGDVFDFLQEMYHLSFRQAVNKAAEYLGADDVELPELQQSNQPPPDLQRMLRRSIKRRSGLLEELLRDRDIDVPADWLYENWDVVDGNGSKVLIPHFDEIGNVTALKQRQLEDGWTSRSVRGSQLTHLYGEWRAQDADWVYLCEGESDTWTVSYIFDGLPVDVLGLPSGAAAAPRAEWLDLLADRAVVLLLEADRAGRESAEKWFAALTDAGADVFVAELPDGEDCTSAGADEIKHAIRACVT